MSIDGGSLAAADLTSLHADAVRLTQLDLREATLSHSEWVECTLSDVRLDRSVGRELIMRMCTLDNVRAIEADWYGAKLENSRALALVLDHAVLRGGSLIDSELTRASMVEADLRDVDASGAILRGADLRGADLRGASLVEADLRGADLRNCDLEGADLDGADLRGAILDEVVRASAASEPTAPAAPSSTSGPAVKLGGPFAELVERLAPSVVELLELGTRRGVLEERDFARLVEDMGRLGISGLDAGTGRAGDAASLFAKGSPLAQVLERVSEVGIGPLVAAVSDRRGDAPGSDETPPPAVARLIHSLMGDAKLAQGATAEDLAAHLIKQVQNSVPHNSKK